MSAQPIGYQFVVDACDLLLPPLSRPGQTASVRVVAGAQPDAYRTPVLYPQALWPGDRILDHLRVALRHEGVQPGVFQALADKVDMPRLLLDDAQDGVQPFHRRLAFLHTFATGEDVPLPPVAQGQRYVDVVNPRLQFTVTGGDLHPQYRVRNNLLGTPRFCPQVFKVPALRHAVEHDPVWGRDSWQGCPPDIQERVELYLYHQETRASWKIEAETPSARRLQAFVELLRRTQHKDFVTASGLAELHAGILGKSGAAPEQPSATHPWRTEQAWVGHANRNWQEVISLLGAPPSDLPDLMAGLLDCHQRLTVEGELHPVVHAACIGFPLVYIHPFSDGNGRAHRFVFHNILAQRQYAPPGTVFPLSAWLLNHRRDYIGSMTDTCRGILGMAELATLPDGHMQVLNDIKAGFRFPDLTTEALSLCRFVEAAVFDELEPDIRFIQNFDKAQRGLDELVEWPSTTQALFIKLCVQNDGTLSQRKRKLDEFRDLSAPLLSELESCVRAAYDLPEPPAETDADRRPPRDAPEAAAAPPPKGW